MTSDGNAASAEWSVTPHDVERLGPTSGHGPGAPAGTGPPGSTGANEQRRDVLVQLVDERIDIGFAFIAKPPRQVDVAFRRDVSIGAVMAAYAASRRAPDGVILEAGFPNARAIFENNPVMSALTLFTTYRFPTARWMTTVSAPALVLHGDSDSVIPYRLGQRLYESLPGPKRFVTIERGHHNDLEYVNPTAFWDAIADLVNARAK